MKKREISLDILRFIAITCVVLLHVVSIFRYKYFLNNNFYFILFTFSDVFTRIGVPIFFMLTGILMFNKEDEDYKSFIKKRIPKLLISYITFSIIYIIYNIIVGHNGISLKDTIQIVTSRLASYHLWYMPVIVLIYFLVPFLKKLANNLAKKELNRLIMIIFIFGNVVSSISVLTGRLGRPLFDNFSLPTFLIYINYLYIGYYLYKYRPKISLKLIIVSILSFILIPLLTRFVSNIEVVDFFLNSTSPFVAFLSSLVVLLVLNKKWDLSYKKEFFLQNISSITLYMYLIHVLIINIISNHISSTIQSASLLGDIGLIISIFLNVWVVSYIMSTIIDKTIRFIKNNKEEVISFLIKIFTVVFGILLIYLIGSLLLNKYKFTKFNYLLLLIGVIVISLIFYFVYKKQEQLFKNRLVNIILLIIYFIFQLIIVYSFAVRPTWDFGTVYYLARDVASGLKKFTDVYYLYICDNNIPIASFFTLLYKPLFILKIEKYTGIVSILINLLAVDISILFIYKIINKLNTKLSKPILLFSMFFSPLVFYLPIFYSDTLSLPFITIGLYYIFKYLFDNKKIKYLIICGLLFGIGSLIKPTIGIIIISLIIVSYLKKNITFKHLLIIVIIFLMPLLLNRTYVKSSFSSEEMNKSKKPFTHFIMMGLKENGGFNEEDMQFTTRIPTYSEKKEKTIEKIKERLYNYYKKHQLLAYYNRKINFTWADGTFYSNRVLGSEPYHPENQKYIQPYLKDSWAYLNMSNAEWLIVLIMMLVGVVFRANLSEKEETIQLITNISIFGLFLFLIIWETRSRYLINFIPVFIISSYIGISAFIKYLKNKKGRRI